MACNKFPSKVFKQNHYNKEIGIFAYFIKFIRFEEELKNRRDMDVLYSREESLKKDTVLLYR